MHFAMLDDRNAEGFERKYQEIFGDRPPVSGIRQVALAVDKDRVAGFLVVQAVAHLEPLWIDPEYRHRLLLMGLVNMLLKEQPAVETAYTTTNDKNMAGILETLAEHLPKRGLHAERLQLEMWRLRRG